MAIIAAETTTRARRYRLYNNCRDGKTVIVGFSGRWVIERRLVLVLRAVSRMYQYDLRLPSRAVEIRDYATLSEVGIRFFNCEGEDWDITKLNGFQRDNPRRGGRGATVIASQYDDIGGGSYCR